MELKTKIKGKMDQNESREYYELKLPKEIPTGSLLVFTVKESRKGIKDGEDLFSDPDIYVSKTTKYPSNKEEAQWYSERYGNDILTIPSYEIDKEEIFYVCMYCQYKCRYELYSYLSKEAPAEIGKVYAFTLTKKSSISYALYVPESKDKEELTVVASNPSLKNYRIFMAKESPSSQNTFQIIPSWTGGYVISITRYNKDYCIDCTYHILFQTEEKSIDVQFTAYFQSTLTKVTSGSPIKDAVKGGTRRCYYFDTSNIDNLSKSQIIVSTNLFSGNVILNINGWKQNPEEKIYKIKDLPYSFNIESDKNILLKKEDFEYFDKQGFDPESEEGKQLHICIYGDQISSYIFNVYFLAYSQALQRFNFISPGTEITGYLVGGQVTRYRILDFNLNKNSIITLSFTQLEGEVEFYSTFCEEKCLFDNELLNQRLASGQVTTAQEVSFSKKNIIIQPKDNKCYLVNKEDDVYRCKTLALVKCIGSPKDICSFKILSSISDQSIFMSPKKTYYNIIPKGKLDLYEILVNDEEVNSIVVVLTSVTGDAELKVEKILDNEGKSNFKGKISRNKDYIPDVVRITPNLLGEKNVVGKYLVKISAASFSSYNLYYYTTRIKVKEEQPNLKDITLTLTEGNIIKDYFPNDISFKIFSYSPQTKEKQDIKIILTRINVHFSFKVYLNFNKIKYNYNINSKYEERLKDYLWSSDNNNELTISKDDKNYSEKGPYYIVVTKDNSYEENENEELDTDSLMMYYLGVTKRGIPFTLNEGVEHSVTLSDQYYYQDYFYIHKNISEPLNIDINILNGEVDVFIDTRELKKENITKIYNVLNTNSNVDDEFLPSSLYMLFAINNYDYIELSTKYLEKSCAKKNMGYAEDNNCYLYIYVIQSRTSRKYHKDSQYIITAQSSTYSGIFLLSGQVYTMNSREDKIGHFIIEEVKHRKGTSIHVQFKNGGGQVYARIPKVPEIGSNMMYPDESNFDYIGEDTYLGKVITISPKVFDRINSNSLKLQILISVIPDENIGDYSNVEYTITYGSEPKRISQNVPYQSFLNSGEYHYFTFYFDESTENIYISLSNMNGDADMYLNYGNDNLPSTIKFDWSSTNLGHEYIDININNDFFKRNKKKNISGYYTLLIVGFTETTYTLYISSHPDKIFPLMDNIPSSCQCQVKGEKCFFRYNNIFVDEVGNDNIKRNEIIFTTQYIYGNGKMYASIYKDQELTNDPNKKYQDFFPDENKFQFSNSLIGKRNYLKVVAENQNYSKDSLVLLTFVCGEKTDVEITSASLKYTPIFSYIDPNRENMFYIKYNDSLSYSKQEESIFNFFGLNDEALIYELHAYIGKAKVKVFTNETIYDDNNTVIGYDYNHIAEFIIKAEYDEEYTTLKTYTENYFNLIHNNLLYNKAVFFSVKPMSDFGFYIQVTYDRSWVNIPIGDSKSYLINKNLMYGYFDINNEYSNVEMSLSLEEFTKKRASLFIKVLVLSKDAKQISSQNVEDKLYHYEIPSNSNYDYKGRTDDILGAISINLNNLPIIKENEKNNKFIRAIFSIEIKKYKFRRGKKYSSGSSNNQENIDDSKISPQSKVNIAILAGINNFKRIDLPQHTYYFSNTSLVPISNNIGYNNQKYRQYDGNKEVKIYSLDKRSNEDKKMIIQIHSCSGKFSYKLTNKIIDYDNNPNDIPIVSNTDEYGRSKYLVDNLKHKHLYLSIKSSQLPQDCDSGNKKDANGVECSKELSYLIYYYSLTDHDYSTKKQRLDIKYRYVKNKYWQIKLIITPLGGKDKYNNIRNQNDIEYNLFWTRNSTLKERLDNICYLSQVLNRNEGNSFNDTKNGYIINIIRNIQLNEKNEYLVENLDSKEIIYVNILARNLKTNELIAYIPLSGITSKPGSSFKRIFISFLVIGFLATITYFAFKYYIAGNNGYEDIRNPKSTEMSSIHSKAGGYQSISLDNY